MAASIVIDYTQATANLVKENDCYLLRIVMADGNHLIIHFHSLQDVKNFTAIMNLVSNNANE